jgi:hypothetical protein
MPTTAVALAAAGVVVVLWLGVSFLPPGRGRRSLEWLATTALFLALGSWFIGLSWEARSEGNTWLLVPFAFLAFVFTAGLCVSTWRTCAHLLRRGGGAESATH